MRFISNQLFGTMQAYKKPEESTKDLCGKVSDLEWRVKCEGVLVNGAYGSWTKIE